MGEMIVTCYFYKTHNNKKSCWTIGRWVYGIQSMGACGGTKRWDHGNHHPPQQRKEDEAYAKG